MRGYPKGLLSKRDFENLLAMPEHVKQVSVDLQKLTSADDSKITIDQGTQDIPKMVQITNPNPAWKRIGFKNKTELSQLAASVTDPTEKGAV